MTNFPIDAVITWVDGDDPVHRAKRLKYEKREQLLNDDIGGEIRYKSIGEIMYCVASLLRFAPFLRKIFIVTDGQDPRLDQFIDEHFPERTTKIEIVDHKVIYRGFEQYLPVFSSCSIETVLWRIPGLSEHYIYLNDDMLLVSPTLPGHYFEDGKAICYAKRFSIPFANFLHLMRPKKNGVKTAGFKDTLVNAALAAGERWNFLYIGHIPLAMRVSTQERFYSEHPDIMERNMSLKFRETYCINPQELFYIVGMKSGDCILKPRKGKDLYVKPKDKKNYMARKLAKFDASDAPFCCFNSLADGSKEDIDLAIGWISRRLGIRSLDKFMTKQ